MPDNSFINFDAVPPLPDNGFINTYAVPPLPTAPPQGGWGVAPMLSQPPSYPAAAPPPLPLPGTASSMRGAPLTPNTTGVPYPAIPPSTNWGNPQVAQWEAGMNLLNAQTGQVGARRAYEAQVPQKWAAEGNVLDARARALSSQSAYLNEQARANAQRMQAQQQITAAANDPKNTIAVARGQRERDVTDYHYRIAGLPTPVEVILPQGFTGQLPPGVRQRLETIADVLTRTETDNDKMRQYNLEAARLATAARGQEVTAAEIASGRVSLSLEQAEQAIRLAGFDVDDAQLAAAATKMPPAPGLAWDDEGFQWVNESQLKSIQRQREDTATSLAPFSLDQLITLLNGDETTPPAISPTQFRAEIKRKYNYLDSTIDSLLQLAAIRKSQQRRRLGLDNPDLLGGGNLPPPGNAGQGPTTTLIPRQPGF